jgi:hypothetical protein
LRPKRSFANKRDTDGDRAEDQRLTATDFVEEEDNEKEVENRSNDVVDTGYE